MAILHLKQKARVKWVMDRYENTKFFHGSINNNKRKNQIDGLIINDKWAMEVKDIKDEAFHFFQQKLKNDGSLSQNL